MVLWLCFTKFIYSEVFKNEIAWCLEIVSTLPEIRGRVGKVTGKTRLAQSDSYLSRVMDTWSSLH